MRRFHDPAAEFVPTCERVFDTPVRVLDGGRAVLVGELKLALEAGERELWLIRVRPIGLEQRLGMVEVGGDVEAAVREAKGVLAHRG